ncbi:MAG: DUF2892 domain-containing protein [Candidatus Nanohaloarchaeota archaeon QJJ-5]|nr:DUF2892 domain-containing protein [Candidatus Nanohaloarchaeota archaeon QJJ-5]
METNVGELDKKVRISLGAVTGAVSLGMLTNYIGGTGVYAAVLGVISLIAFGTALSGTCGLYKILGVNTCEGVAE